MSKEQFNSKLKEAADFALSSTITEVVLFHHNDADGISSGTIALKAFERAHYKVRRYSLENVYPIVLKKFF